MVDKETRRQALANYLEVELEDVVDGYDDDVFECNGREYIVLDDEEADKALVDDIENSIDDLGLEAFTPSFQNWIIENAIDNPDWFEEALQEDMEYYVNDMDEEELIKELLERGYLSEEDVHYADDEDMEHPLINDENKLQDARESYTSWLVEDAGDAYDWYKMNFGENQVRELIKNGEIGLDFEAIAKEAVSWDGRGHFLSGYDGNEIELDDDLYAYRTN